jgi:uncharacterized membrane protein YoaT (DUF817 family)
MYKTSAFIGSWSYPEPGYLKILSVPLYSGFMYAAIGSYVAAAWKNLNIKIENGPAYVRSVILCALIYLNFFTNHFMYDFRLILILGTVALYWKTKIRFTPRKKTYKMPIVIGFLLVAFFVWIAENVGTFYGAWKYPYQIHAWQAVTFQKITSWFLMVIISFIIVAWLKHIKEGRVQKRGK